MCQAVLSPVVGHCCGDMDEFCHLTWISNLAILICASATPGMLKEFKSNSQLESAIFVSNRECGKLSGPLLVGSLSEI